MMNHDLLAILTGLFVGVGFVVLFAIPSLIPFFPADLKSINDLSGDEVRISFTKLELILKPFL